MYMHLSGIDHLLVGAGREGGIDHEVTDAIHGLFAQAVSAGRGDDDIAVLFDVARARRAPAICDSAAGARSRRVRALCTTTWSTSLLRGLAARPRPAPPSRPQWRHALHALAPFIRVSRERATPWRGDQVEMRGRDPAGICAPPTPVTGRLGAWRGQGRRLPPPGRAARPNGGRRSSTRGTRSSPSR